MIKVIEELGETSRRMILGELRSGPRNVGQIVKATGLKQPNVSNHLNRMRLRGVVAFEKVGRQVFYRLASPEMASLVQSVFGDEPAQELLDFPTMLREYARTAVKGDEAGCQAVVDCAMRAKAPLLEIYEELLGPAMGMVGAWYRVEAIDEAQEHMASSITERVMARIVSVAGPARKTDFLCVLGCAPDSHHVIGLRMISDYLRLQGWRTLFIGANVPIPSFVATVAGHRPDMVLLSCSSEESLKPSQELVKGLAALRGDDRRFVIGIGGVTALAHPGRLSQQGADFFSSDLRSFANEILPEIERTGRAPVGAGSTVRDN